MGVFLLLLNPGLRLTISFSRSQLLLCRRSFFKQGFGLRKKGGKGHLGVTEEDRRREEERQRDECFGF